MINKVHNEDCQETVKRLTSAGIKADMVVTSPPYWGLRSFDGADKIWGGDLNCEHAFVADKKIKKSGGKGNADFGKLQDVEIHSAFCNKCGAWKGQLGLEPDFRDYIKHLCDIFDGVGRVLKDTGSLWVNLGDTYSTVSGRQRADFSVAWPKYKAAAEQMNLKQPKPDLPSKCLVGIPERFMLEMIDRGWILRNKIIWYKRNAMPSSAKDRFTVDYDNLYWFVKKSKGYYFEQQIEPAKSNIYDLKRPRNKANEPYANKAYKGVNNPISAGERLWFTDGGRNKRCVWDIQSKKSPYEHFATFPEELVITPIKSTCPVGGIAYDPFAGTGTTIAVAVKHDRLGIGSEISENHCNDANKRIEAELQQGRLDFSEVGR